MKVRNFATAALLSAVLGIILMVSPIAARSIDPFAIYGKEIRFDILRDGATVGMHSVRFEQHRDMLLVHSNMSIAIRLLGIKIYSYRYDSRAWWHNDRLVRLVAEIDDNGTLAAIRARSNGKSLIIEGPGGQLEASTEIFPTNHWHSAVVKTSRVLNTLTGRVNVVRIVDLGAAVIETATGQREARRFRYTGELQADVWYDLRGRWVKLRFQAKDGSTIDYVCRHCGKD